jgi:hypothetical protein
MPRDTAWNLFVQIVVADVSEYGVTKVLTSDGSRSAGGRKVRLRM